MTVLVYVLPNHFTHFPVYKQLHDTIKRVVILSRCPGIMYYDRLRHFYHFHSRIKKYTDQIELAGAVDEYPSRF